MLDPEQMTDRLPICTVDTVDGIRVTGQLYIKNSRVVVLLNNLCTSADLGPLAPKRDHQVVPEADLYIIPATQVTDVTELARS